MLQLAFRGDLAHSGCSLGREGPINPLSLQRFRQTGDTKLDKGPFGPIPLTQERDRARA